MAATGRKTLAEMRRYTESAMREGLADSASTTLISRPNREQTVVNPPHRPTTKHTEDIEKKGQ